MLLLDLVQELGQHRHHAGLAEEAQKDRRRRRRRQVNGPRYPTVCVDPPSNPPPGLGDVSSSARQACDPRPRPLTTTAKKNRTKAFGEHTARLTSPWDLYRPNLASGPYPYHPAPPPSVRAGGVLLLCANRHAAERPSHGRRFPSTQAHNTTHSHFNLDLPPNGRRRRLMRYEGR